MKKLSSFTKGVILLVTCFIVFKYVVTPPLPASLVYLYMGMVLIAILAQVSIEDEKLEEFVRPLREVLVREEKAKARTVLFSTFPLAVAALVFSQYTVSTAPPAELRTVHPAPPAEIEFRGEKIKLVGLENPYRHDAQNYEKYVEEGRTVYYQNCHFCHGDNLDGNGMFADGFNPRPANFRDAGTIAMLQESFVFWRVSKGGPGLPRVSTPWSSAMPAWETMLTKDEIWQVILFIYDATGQTPRTWE
ncbi:MAG: c-type cytochrome [bacterium]